MSDIRKSETRKDETSSVSEVQTLNEAYFVATSDPSNSQAIEAPLWLKERMTALRAMPPPTLEKMRTQFRASAESRRKSNDKDNS